MLHGTNEIMSDLSGQTLTPESESPKSASNQPVMIVGVGASAGGLEAFTELLQALLPAPTGMAFIFIQHLDPSQQSLLPELLARVTPMRVLEIEDGMAVEADHVYVAPPSVNLVIMNGVLTLQASDRLDPRHKRIDFFFRSLASDQVHQAVGVLLSGADSDGVQGLKAIKAEGGITLVQDEQSTKFDAMPRSAILARVADLVLPPAGIAKELVKLRNHYPRLTRAPLVPEEAAPPEDQDAMRRILALVWSATQIDFSAYKQSTLRRRILRRMALHNLERLNHYYQYLVDNPAEAKALFHDLVINVTGFFRDPEVFETLKEEIFPQMIEGKSPELPLRVWVPGCSTGEEVYSLAIAILELLGSRPTHIPIQLFGTDISEDAINKARAGLYPETIEAEMSPERLRRFFVKNEGGYQVSKPIRDLCVFARHNVGKDPPFSSLDLISCRNVLIYFGPELQRKVLPMFHYALNPRGFLLLGNSESIGVFANLFTMAHKRHKIYTKKSVPPRLVLALAQSDHGFDRQGLGAVLPENRFKVFDPQKEADRLLLDRYGPPGVLINSDMNILQFRGRTGPFLEPSPGSASFNLLRMAREGLIIPLHTALHEADQSNRVVRKDDVLFKGNGENYRTTLEVIPLVNPAQAAEKFFLVLFQELRPASGPPVQEAASAAKPPAEPPRDKSEQEQEIQRLREELAAIREYLQSVVESQEVFNEELRSANEEILSSNEELQSTNEELETAKEELQSANEELTTLNEELHVRNQELGQLNDDLTNLLSSINIAIVMLDNDLRIRRFTPPAEKLFSLIPTDIGRPFSDIHPRISVPDLMPFVRKVLETLTTKEVEVRDGKGRWYNLRMRPYRAMDRKIDGVVLALVDVDALKRDLGDRWPAPDFMEAFLAVAREPLLILTRDFRVKRANSPFYRSFEVSPEATEGRSLFALPNGQWENPGLRAALEQVAAQGAPFENLSVEFERPNRGRRKLALNGRRLDLNAGSEPLILLAIG